MNRVTWGFDYEVNKEDVELLQVGIKDSIREVAIHAKLEGIRDDKTLPAEERDGAVLQHSPSPNLTVDCLPFRAINKSGYHIDVPTLQVIDMTKDDLNVTTAVATSGNTKWVSIFVSYIKKDEIRTIDGNGEEYYYRHRDYFKFHIIQGVEDRKSVV